MAKILVIDDEETILDIIDNLLTDEGHETSLIKDGHEAIKLLSEENKTFDLILLDLSMPEIGGIELLEHLNEKQVRLPKVIILTGMMEIDSYVRAKELGACEYITKPFDFDTFLAIIESNISS